MFILGNALWQVTCYLPQCLTPSAPPPPYTLYDFNIELPPIEWPTTGTRIATVETANPYLTRKRTPAKETQRAIIQNLLRLAGQCSGVVGPVRESRIHETADSTL